MKSLKIQPLLCVFALLCVPFCASGQVTIGSGIEPVKGSVLDLKEFAPKADNSTSEKGVIIPRVSLVDLNSLSPLLSGADLSNTDLAKELSGTLVYNVTKISGLNEGLHYWNGSKWVAVAQFWSLSGNAGTNPGENFLGTTDNQPLIFRINNQPAGYISNLYQGNLSFGQNANPNNTGSRNIALGREALSANTDGILNVAIGGEALKNNTTGTSNTVIGYANLSKNTTGTDNIAIGSNVLGENMTASGNTAIGNNALQQTQSEQNTAIGYNALKNNMSGYANIAIGSNSGIDILHGNNNIFIGANTSLAENSENKMNIGNLIFGNRMTGTSSLPNGNVGIGTSSVDDSAILELSSPNKGFLGPRVALQSMTDVTTIANPASGLLVYNLGTAGLDYTGYVFWNGSTWRALNNSSIAQGTIGQITCNGVSLTPAIYTSGIPYTGTMMVPYTGGDGGIYPAQTIGPVNGLTASLAPGNFNVGAGTLAYTVTGTPTVTSPETTSFPITIGGKSCNAVVGSGDGIALGELVYYKTTLNAGLSGVWLSDYANDLPVIGGKLRLDAYFNASSNAGNGTVTMNPRLVNTSSNSVKLWFSAMTTIDSFNAGNYLIAAGGYLNLDNGIYYGYGYNDILGTSTPRASGSGEGGHQEVVTLDLSLEGKWYRIYYFPIVDNMNTVSNTDNQRIIHLSIQRLY